MDKQISLPMVFRYTRVQDPHYKKLYSKFFTLKILQIESTVSVLSETGFTVRRRNYDHCSNRWQVFALMN